DHAEAVAGQVDDRRRIAAAISALGSLRRPEREVLVLCLWEGMEYADAALALGIPVGTVRSRLSRARTKLRGLADAELASPGRELTDRPRQVKSDRAIAVRSAKEGIR
ncbi:sigma-70 family RNA polymerase sigma factor, partial [Streptomyces sp. NPDC005195]|uniref:RNA polymerase sigma factor n=1 Tax=Streptomyces sp. NPDC005195 TaxID=3154561 RepID=UPI0033B2F19D